MKKYRTVFIGNRPLILSSLLNHPKIDLVHAFIIKDSLIRDEDCAGVPTTVCEVGDAHRVLGFLHAGEYDICASAGCPYILPISKLPEKVFINSHPSALPYGRGIHPVNECIFSNHKKAGSTLHYLVDKLDAGDIIHQETFDLTDDIDLDLLYSFIFKLEQEVFDEGLEKILVADLACVGLPQQGEGTYYSRKPEDQIVEVCRIGTKEFLEKVRAFSVDSLGVFVNLPGRNIAVYQASPIFNEFVITRFGKIAPGNLVFSSSGFLLLRLLDGIVRIDRWRDQS